MTSSPVNSVRITPVLDATSAVGGRVVFDGISPPGGVYLSTGKKALTRASLKEKRDLGMQLLKLASRFKEKGKEKRATKFLELAKNYLAETSVSSIRYEREKWTQERLACHVAAGGEVYLFDKFPEELRRVIVKNTIGIHFIVKTHLSAKDIAAFRYFLDIKFAEQGTDLDGLCLRTSNWSDGTSTLTIEHDNALLLVMAAESFYSREWSLWPKVTNA